MPPVPVYADSPIAAKSSGTAPQTVQQGTQESKNDASGVTTTAYSPSQPITAYSQAQPGAAPAIPSATAVPQAPRGQDVRPTPTQALKLDDGPPPPQPGAVPKSVGTRTHLPPPPKVGEKFVPPQTTSAPQAAPVSYPSQMSIPPPTAAYPAQQLGTSTAAAPSSTYGNLGLSSESRREGGHSLQHPPGYQQDANASELDRFQRAAIMRDTSEENPGPSQPEDGNVWNAAKKWAQTTGEKLAAVESEVWKKINKE